MKKNIFYSFIVAILLSSCQGMDLMPADKMSDGDYWLTENDFKIYANGLYPSLMKFNGDDNLAQYDQKADFYEVMDQLLFVFYKTKSERIVSNTCRRSDIGAGFLPYGDDIP